MSFALAFLVLPTAALGHPHLAVGEHTEGPGRLATLSKGDREYLNGLIQDFLFDPRGALRVRVQVPIWCVANRYRPTLEPADRKKTVPHKGWLVPGQGDRPGRVFFTDGFSIPAPARETVEILDFVAESRKWYGSERRGTTADRRFDIEREDDTHLTLAAWLCRLGHDGLAARALRAARDDKTQDPREALREELADSAYGGMHDAFCLRADVDALAHGERLVRLYPDIAKLRYPQGELILADLKRRRCAGAFGRPASAGFPSGYQEWPTRRKVAFLIESLDEAILIRDHSRNFFRSYIHDPRIDAIVQLGETVLPSLIEVVEKDSRISRCPELGGRHDTPTGRFVSVREHARDAIRSILRVKHLDPNNESEGKDPLVFAQLTRNYLNTFGKLPFDERMMKVLTDPSSHIDACREAATNLAECGSTTGGGWSRANRSHPESPRKANPAVEKFKGPTAAEAILAVMDRARADKKAHRDRWPSWDYVEQWYLNALVQLGDARIVPDLARRAADATDVGQSRRIALACHALGASGPLVVLARRFEAGALALARDPEESSAERGTAEREFQLLVDALAESNQSDCDRGLYALAIPEHSFHKLAADALLSETDQSWHELDAGVHPFCLELFRRALDDTRPTGRHYYLRGDEVETWSRQSDQQQRNRRVPIDSDDTVPRAEHAQERVCDVAAMQSTNAVCGAPAFHPLFRDAEKVIAELKEFTRRHGRNLRRLTPFESDRLSGNRSYPSYVPDIKPLRRPATSQDVLRGKAVFTLNGTGKVPDGRIPDWVVLKVDPAKLPSLADRIVRHFIYLDGIASLRDPHDAPVGLVVQAEVGADGSTNYGVIFRHSMRAVREDEVERFEPREKR